MGVTEMTNQVRRRSGPPQGSVHGEPDCFDIWKIRKKGESALKFGFMHPAPGFCNTAAEEKG